jgi:hypothetical protein
VTPSERLAREMVRLELKAREAARFGWFDEAHTWLEAREELRLQRSALLREQWYSGVRRQGAA